MPPNRWPTVVAAIGAIAIVGSLVYATVHGARVNDALAVALAEEREDHAIARDRWMDRQEWLEGKYDALLEFLDTVGAPSPQGFRGAGSTTIIRNSGADDDDDDGDDDDGDGGSSTRPPAAAKPKPTKNPTPSAAPGWLELPDVKLPKVPDVPDLPLP